MQNRSLERIHMQEDVTSNSRDSVPVMFFTRNFNPDATGQQNLPKSFIDSCKTIGKRLADTIDRAATSAYQGIAESLFMSEKDKKIAELQKRGKEYDEKIHDKFQYFMRIIEEDISDLVEQAEVVRTITSQLKEAVMSEESIYQKCINFRKFQQNGNHNDIESLRQAIKNLKYIYAYVGNVTLYEPLYKVGEYGDSLTNNEHTFNNQWDSTNTKIRDIRASIDNLRMYKENLTIYKSKIERFRLIYSKSSLCNDQSKYKLRKYSATLRAFDESIQTSLDVLESSLLPGLQTKYLKKLNKSWQMMNHYITEITKEDQFVQELYHSINPARATQSPPS